MRSGVAWWLRTTTRWLGLESELMQHVPSAPGPLPVARPAQRQPVGNLVANLQVSTAHHLREIVFPSKCCFPTLPAARAADLLLPIPVGLAPRFTASSKENPKWPTEATAVPWIQQGEILLHGCEAPEQLAAALGAMYNLAGILSTST